ncbi:MAG: hypothetical protein RR314_02840 [Oscillospiraceae bacterium]
MSDYNDFKEAFKATVNGVADIARDIAVGAGDKAKSLGRTAKLSMEQSAERENARKVYTEIGRLYYETNRKDPGEFFVQLFDEVTLANDRIEAIDRELAELKKAGGDDDCTDASFEDVVDADEQEADCSCNIEVEIVEDTSKDE